MQSKSDAELLRDYAERGVEAAFAEIVRRHTNLVYSAALRQVESPGVAAEITQNAFVALVRGAQPLLPRLAPEAALGGWLCRVTRNLCLNFRRDEYRRQTREKRAVTPIISSPESSSDWEQMRPVLDEAMAALNEVDHDALVLRFFENQDFRTVGAALGLTDDAAQKRVTRALEKLRHLLAGRGVRTSGGALSLLIVANGIQAAPAGLTAAILTATAVAGASATTTALIATTKTLAMTTLQKAFVTVTATLLAAGIYQTHRSVQLREQVRVLQQQQASLQGVLDEFQRDGGAATRAGDESGLTSKQVSELAKLRAEVGRLRQDSRELARLKNGGAGSAGASDAEIDGALSLIESQAKQIKQRLEENPAHKIPEIALLTGKDWLNVVGLTRPTEKLQLETDADYRAAFGGVRSAAKRKFGTQLQQALRRYVGAHGGELPSDTSQLQEYFDQPIDAAILQRYGMLKSGKAFAADRAYLVKEIAPPIDEEHDTRIAFSLTGVAEQSGLPTSAAARAAGPDRSCEVVWAAMLEQAKVNEGKLSRDPSVLAAYLSQPLDAAKVKSILSQIPENVVTADEFKAGLNSPARLPQRPINPFD